MTAATAVAGSIQSSSGEAFGLLRQTLTVTRSGTKLTATQETTTLIRLIQTSDGGYAVAGYTDATGAGGYDFYLIKTTSTGTTATSSSVQLGLLRRLSHNRRNAVIIVIGLVLFIMARTRKPTYPIKNTK